MNFNVGDRIVVVKNMVDGYDVHESRPPVGMTGTITTFRESPPFFDGLKYNIGVAYDAEFEGGHDLNGELEDYNGWWTPQEFLTLVEANIDVDVSDFL